MKTKIHIRYCSLLFLADHYSKKYINELISTPSKKNNDWTVLHYNYNDSLILKNSLILIYFSEF